MKNEESESFPGWQAIKDAIARVYDDREERYWGSQVPSYLGGPPLDAISIFKNLQPRPHWHLIGQGLSDLFGQNHGAATPELSGAGFEFTFRIACDPDDPEPPRWAMSFLMNLAHIVREYGAVFGPFHTIDANGPIALEHRTELSAAAFVLDPALGEIDTPNGHLEFLQIVGLTADELDAKLEWNCQGLIEMLARDNPLLITDLARTSILKDPATASDVRRRMAQEGSTSGELHVESIRWKMRVQPHEVELTITAMMVPSILSLLRGRLLHGRDVHLRNESDPTEARFEPAEQSSWRVEKPILHIALNPALVQRFLKELTPQRGTHRWPELPGFTLIIEPTEIRDTEGNITRVIG